ncbi:histidine phosphatase family protein [Larkinella sp. VNQ87]|uniref:histidine phosphatase family protein n=1 Tax=Larkinella sp. VNQ87 TaxID=3400921 RepID=UPI003BFE4C21
MKRIYLFLTLLIGLGFTACQSDNTQTTTVYLVRHAEKVQTDSTDSNPPLAPAGVVRAQHLAERLASVEFDAVYSTPFQRNINTVKPLADARSLTIQTYQWHDYDAIRQILTREKGKTLLFCGHGDNILPIIRNAGATPPLKKIGKEDYQHLFKLVIRPDGTAEASVETFN